MEISIFNYLIFNIMDKYNKKINFYKNYDIYVIFYSPKCKYSVNALDLLKHKNKSFKGYNVDRIPGGFGKLLNYLNNNRQMTNFLETHKTKPIIFHRGKFVGGFIELKSYLNNH